MPKLRQRSSVEDIGKENMSMNESVCPDESSERAVIMENFLRDFDIQVRYHYIMNLCVLMNQVNVLSLWRISSEISISR